MRVVWFTPLILACFYSSLGSAENQSSCGASPTDEVSGCSVAPHLIVTRATNDPPFILSRATRSLKHRRRNKARSRSRLVRSAEEEFVATEEDDDSQQSSKPRHPFSRYEEQQAMQVQGDLRNYIRHIQASTFIPSSRYCPHCRQLLPPESPFLNHPIDPRVFLPLQTPRFHGIPLNNPSSIYVPREEIIKMNTPSSPDDISPLNYRMTEDESETYSPDLFNQTVFSPNKIKDFKKTSPGLSDVYLDADPSNDSSSSSLSNTDKASIVKKSKLPSVEELTKYLEKKNSS